MDERVQLIDGARAFGVTLSDRDALRLLRLLDELTYWNRRYNLTAISDRAQMVTHHLLDSLSIQGDLRGASIADVGTGAGFPGLPLAVVNPERHFTLIDSNHKKVRFIEHAARALELSNVTAVHARAEMLRAERPFATVTARAVAALPELLERVAPLCGAETRVLAMKGKQPADEIAALAGGWHVIETRPLVVPGLAEARCVVILIRHNLSPGP
jgi:16S rRNA (guanine527-N7)-methyltransferase